MPNAKRIVFAAFLSLAAAISHATCAPEDCSGECNDAIGRQGVSNVGGTSFVMVTSACETEVFYVSRGEKKAIFHLKGGHDSHNSSFTDLNKDGFFEFEILNGCDMVNCDSTIYVVDRNTLEVRKVLSASMAHLEKVRKYFVAMERIAGYGAYMYTGYAIRDFKHLYVSQQPSFTLRSYYDFETEKHICHLAMGRQRDDTALVRQLIKRYCSGEFTVEVGEK